MPALPSTYDLQPGRVDEPSTPVSLDATEVPSHKARRPGQHSPCYTESASPLGPRVRGAGEGFPRGTATPRTTGSGRCAQNAMHLQNRIDLGIYSRMPHNNS